MIVSKKTYLLRKELKKAMAFNENKVVDIKTKKPIRPAGDE